MATMKQDKQDGASNYLLKTEPSEYSFADLQKDKETVWDGVSNPVALRNLREMKPGTRLVSLRDWRSEDGGGDGFCAVGGCVESEESGGRNQGREGAGEACDAGAN